MSRTRTALLVAWGLLTIGLVIQVIDGGSDANDADGPPVALADRVDGAETKRGPIPPPRSVESGPMDGETAGAVAEIEPAENGEASTASTAADPSNDPTVTELFETPASWPASTTPATVATVTGDGVAALARPEPGSETHWFPNPTQFGGDRTFLVVDDTSSEEYLKVSLPVMPNGQEGWIPRSAVELAAVSYRAEVDLSEASVTVWDGAEVVLTTRTVIGRPSAPTPLGRFYVRDLIAQPDPEGDFGPWIIALSGFSEVLDSFDGGLPAIALHGTDEPAQIGHPLSSGCLRVPNEVITVLAETVPLGTPVTIVA